MSQRITSIYFYLSTNLTHFKLPTNNLKVRTTPTTRTDTFARMQGILNKNRQHQSTTVNSSKTSPDIKAEHTREHNPLPMWVGIGTRDSQCLWVWSISCHCAKTFLFEGTQSWLTNTVAPSNCPQIRMYVTCRLPLKALPWSWITCAPYKSLPGLRTGGQI